MQHNLLQRVRRAIFQQHDIGKWTPDKTQRAYKITLPRCPRCGTPCDGTDDDQPICPWCDEEE